MTKDETLAALKAAIAVKGDIPSTSVTMTKIASAINSEACNSHDLLVQAILSDVGLTQKVLRLANSPMYSAFGGAVTTISKAIFILGTETVGHLALGLKLVDNFCQSANSDLALRELSSTVMTSTVARNVAQSIAKTSSEDLAVFALLRGAGRLAVCLYLPSTFTQIEDEVKGNIDKETDATLAAMGATYPEIANWLANEWGLPSSMCGNLTDTEDLTAHAVWAADVCDYSRKFVHAIAVGQSSTELAALSAEFAPKLGTNADSLQSCAQQAFDECENKQARATLTIPRAGTSAAIEANAEDGVRRTSLQKLTAGLTEAQNMERQMHPSQLAGLIAELLWDAFDCSRSLFFLRRPALKRYELMLGYGADTSRHIRRVYFDDAFSPDAFHLAMTSGTPVFLSSTQEASISRRLPAWLRETVGVPRSMFLLPILLEKRSTGLLMLDWGATRSHPPLSPDELRYIDSFRQVLERSFIHGAERRVA